VLGDDPREEAGRVGGASVAIAQGHDVRTVAGRLGHANPAVTLRVYAHAFGAADQALATGLGDILKRNDA
jgi:integrase